MICRTMYKAMYWWPMCAVACRAVDFHPAAPESGPCPRGCQVQWHCDHGTGCIIHMAMDNSRPPAYEPSHWPVLPELLPALFPKLLPALLPALVAGTRGAWFNNTGLYAGWCDYYAQGSGRPSPSGVKSSRSYTRLALAACLMPITCVDPPGVENAITV